MTYQEAHEILGQERKYPRVLVFSQYPAMNEAVKLALVAIERRMPKKVNNIENHYLSGDDIEKEYNYSAGNCPYCNQKVYRDEEHITKSCDNCGQALDWEE